MNVYPIAKLTFKETIKEKSFIGFIIISIAFIFVAYFLSEISAGDNVKISMDFILAFDFFASSIFLIFLSSLSIHRDIRDRIIYLVLSKPFNRSDYVIGKFIGFILSALALNVVLFITSTIGTVLIGYLSRLCIPHTVSFFRMFLFFLSEFSLNVFVVAVSIALCMVFSSELLSVFTGMIVFLIGLELSSVKELASVSKLVGQLNKLIVDLAYYVFPNFSLFDLKSTVVHASIPLNLSYVCLITVYGLIYSLILIFIACSVFRERDL